MPDLSKNQISTSLVSTKIASEISGYNSDYLGRVCREGKIKGTQVGRAWLIDKESLLQFVESQQERKRELAQQTAKVREQEYKSANKTTPVFDGIKNTTQKATQKATEAARAVISPIQRSHFSGSTRGVRGAHTTHNRPLVAAAVALVFTAGTAYASTAPQVQQMLARMPENIQHVADAVMRPRTINDSFRITETAPAQKIVAAEFTVPNAKNISRGFAYATGAKSNTYAQTFAAASVGNSNNTDATFASHFSTEENARVAHTRIAFVTDAVAHPSQVAIALAQEYVQTGATIFAAAHTVGDTYLATVHGIADSSLATAGVVRDVVANAPTNTNALLALYERGAYAWVDASHTVAEVSAGTVYNTGGTIGALATAAPTAIVNAREALANAWVDRSLALANSAADSQTVAGTKALAVADSIGSGYLGAVDTSGNAVGGALATAYSALPSVPGVSAPAVTASAQNAANAAHNAAQTLAAAVPALPEHVSFSTISDLTQDTMLGMAGKIMAWADGTSAGTSDANNLASAQNNSVAQNLTASVISFAPISWQRTIQRVLVAGGEIAQALVHASVRAVADTFSLPGAFAPELAVVPFGPTQTIALPQPTNLGGANGIALGNDNASASGSYTGAVGPTTYIQNIINNFSKDALGTSFNDAVLAIIGPYVQNSIDSAIGSVRGGSGSGDNVSSNNAHLTNVNINGGSASLGTADIGTLIAGSSTIGSLTTTGTTTLATTTVNGDLTVTGTITAGSLAVTSVTSAGAIVAPYFTATSTTSTSTFPNLDATNAHIASGVIDNATSTNFFATNFSSAVANITSAVFGSFISNLATITTAGITNLTATSSVFVNSTTTNAVATNLTATNATLGNASTTNLYAANGTIDNATFGNATSTNFFSTIASAVTGFFDTIFATNATFVNSTTTNATTTNFFAANATTTNLSATNAQVTNGVIDNATSTNSFATNLGATNATFGNATSTNFFTTIASAVTGFFDTLFATNAQFVNSTTTNATSTNFFATNGFISNLIATIANFATATITNLTGTNSQFVNSTTTNATTTNLFAANATTTNLSATNGTITNLGATNATSTNLFATNLSGTNAQFANSTSTNFFSALGSFTNAIFGSFVSNLATITTAGITNLTATSSVFVNSTTTNAVATNLTATNASLGNASTTNLYAANGTIDNATSTNFFSALGSFTNAIVNSLTATIANITNATIANLTGTNATFVNSTTTNATTTNLFATNATTTNFRATNGNIDNATTTNLAVTGLIGSNLTPAINNQYSVGSPGAIWSNGYFDSIHVNNFFVASTSIDGTASNVFSINSANSTADTQDSTIVFNRGSVAPNATLTWNSTLKRFDFNQPVQSANLIASTTFTLGTSTFNSLLGSGLANNGGVLTVTVSSTSLALDSQYFKQGGNSFGATATIGTKDNNPLNIITNNSVVGTFLANGFLGLGTTSPTERLSVAGNAIVSGSLKAASLVTTGNANVGSLTIGSLSGFLKATAGAVTTALVDLSTDVSSTLPVGNGGTGANTLTGLLIGNGTGAFTATTLSSGIAGQISDETGTGALVFGTSPTFGGTTIFNNFTAVSATTTNSVVTNLTVGGSTFNSLLGAGLANVGGALTVTVSSTSLALDTTYFKNGGNAFGGLATLGTTDANPLRFITGNLEAGRFDTSGNFNTTGSITAGSQFIGLGGTGAANTPSYTFNGDLTTGIFHPASNQIGFSTGGIQRAVIDGNGFLGIGTTTPAVALNIAGTTFATTQIRSLAISDTDNATLSLRRARAGTTALLANDVLGGIGWRGHDGTSYGSADVASINVMASHNFTTSDHGTYMAFSVTLASSTTSVVPLVLYGNNLSLNYDIPSPVGVQSGFYSTILGKGDNTTYKGVAAGSFQAKDRSDVNSSNKGVLTGLIASVVPLVARNNVPYDDVNGLLISNDGVAKATDAIYLGHNAGIAGSEWLTTFTSDANSDYGIRLEGTYTAQMLDLAGKFTVNANGSLGIGSTTPTSRLSVVGTAGATSPILTIASSSNASYFGVNSTGAITFNGLTGNIGQLLQSFGAGAPPQWVATSTLGFATGTVTSAANQVAYYNASGLLGGTSGFSFDGTNLSVGGTITATGQYIGLGGTGAANTPAYTFSGDLTTGIFHPGSNLIGFTTGGIQRAVIDGNGNLGVGTSSPLARLSVKGAGTTTGINFQTTDSNNSPLFTILDSGLAGIGTAAPTNQLTIATNTTNIGAGIAIYNTTDQTTNFERLTMQYNNGAYRLLTSAGGTGTLRNLVVGATAGGQISFGSAGPFVSLTNGMTNNTPNGFVSTNAVSNASTGTPYIFSVNPTISQSSTAGYVALQIQPTETSLGSGSKLLFQAGTSTAPGLFNITNAGNVGIGTTTPFAKLTVVGDVSITGGGLYDTNGTRGTIGQLLQTTGSTVQWVSTSTLGFASSTSVGSANQVAYYNSSGVLGGTSGFSFDGTNLSVGGTITATGQHIGIGGTGAANTPAYTFSGDLTTGIFHPASNQIGFTTGGIQRAVIDGNGNLGIGSSSPNYKLTATIANSANVDDGLNLDRNAGTSMFGFRLRSTAGGVFRGAVTGYRSSGSASYEFLSFGIDANGGNVGVGTTTPNTTLTLSAFGNNGFNISGDSANTASSSRLYFSNAVSGQSAVLRTINSDFLISTLGTVGTDSGTERLRITGAGNVGIGSSSPLSTLSVTGSGTTNPFTIASSSGLAVFTVDSSGNTTIANTLTSAGAINAQNGVALSLGRQISWGNATNIVGGTGNDGAIRFNTNSLERLTILQNGNVGIGSTTPLSTLSVTGTGTTNPFTVASSSGNAMFSINSSGAALFNNQAGSLGTVLQSFGAGAAPQWVSTTTLGFASSTSVGSANQVAYYNSSGVLGGTSGFSFDGTNLGVGGTITSTGQHISFGGTAAANNPSYTFASDLSTGIFHPANNNLGFSTGGIERLRIDGNGNVGIATSTPGFALTVAGQGFFSNGGSNALLVTATGNRNNPLMTITSDGSSNGDNATTTDKGLLINLLTGGSSVNYGYALNVKGAGNPLFNVELNGNVGIGTSTPDAQLTINGAGQTTAALNTSGALGGTLALTDTGTAAGSGGAIIFGATNAGVTKRFAAIKGLLTNNTNNGAGDLAFSTRNASADAALTERLRITSTGTIGIGTTTPNAALDISYGNIALELGGDSGAFTRTDATSKLARVVTAPYLNSTLPTAAFIATNASATSQLSIGGGSGLAYAATQLDFYTALTSTTTTGTSRLTINSSGFVGIGTTTPLYNFDVSSAGNAQIAHFSNTSGTNGAIIDIQNYAQKDAVIRYYGGTAVNFVTGLDSANNNFVVGLGNSSFNIMATTSKYFNITQAGNVGIGTTTPVMFSGSNRKTLEITDIANGANLRLDGGTGTAEFGMTSTGDAFLGTRTNNILSILTNNGAAMTVLANGSVGIGTTSPGFPLDVVGAGQVFQASQNGGSGQAVFTLARINHASQNNIWGYNITNGTGAVANGSLLISPQGGATTSDLGFSGLAGGFSAGGQLVIKGATGNVGIGTTSPGEKLTIAGSGATRLTISDSSSTGIGRLVASANDVFLQNASVTGNLYLGANNQNTVTLTPSGNVGIGSTTPLSTLSVTGTGTTNPFTIASSSGLTTLTVLSNGNVGIGTAAPSQMLHVNGAALVGGTLFIGDTAHSISVNGSGTVINNANSGSSGNLMFQTVSTERMRIDAAGNVGIGTSTPNTTLQVNTSALSTGLSATNGIRLTSAGNTGSTLDFGLLSNGSGGRPFIQANTIGFAATDLLFQPYGGNIGIGTTTPNTRLTITSSGANGINLDQDTVTPSASSRLLFSSNTGNNFGIYNNGGLLSLNYGAVVNGTGGTAGLVMTSAGFIGIGNTPTHALDVTGSTTISGFLRVGSNSNPANLTPGDINGTRLSIGNAALGQANGNGDIASFTGTMTETSSNALGVSIQPTINPASDSTANFRSLSMSALVNTTSNITGNAPLGVNGGYFESRILSVGTLSAANGSYSNVIIPTTATSIGNITDIQGAAFKGLANASTTLANTITNNNGIHIYDATKGGAPLTITNNAGIVIEAAVAGTNNTALLIGTNNIPTGNFGIYNTSGNNNYFAGSIGVGTTTPLAQIETVSAGNTTVTGFQSTNTNTGGSLAAAQIVVSNTVGSANLMVPGSSYSTVGQFQANYAILRSSGALSGLKLGTGGAVPLTLFTSDTERLRIDSSGNVGIGTTSPGVSLAVAGSGFFNGNLTATNITATGTLSIATLTATGNGTIAGYLRVGSNTAPTNTTAGDFTANRISIGANAALGAGTIREFADFSGTLTDTASGAVGGVSITALLAPVTDSASNFRSLSMSNTINTASNFTALGTAGVTSGWFENRITNAGTIAQTAGITSTGLFVPTAAASLGTVAETDAGQFVAINSFGNALTSTVTKAIGVHVLNSTVNTLSVVGQAGVVIDALSGATNNTALLIGTATIPTGNFSIYNNSTNANYFNGNIGIGTTSPAAPLHIDSVTLGSLPVIYLSGAGGTVTKIGRATNMFGGTATAGDLGLNAATGQSFFLGTGGTIGLTIASTTANVGIGTTTPTNLLTLAAGTATNPSFSFGDSTTGFFRNAANQIAFSASGVAVTSFSATGIATPSVFNLTSGSNAQLSLTSNGTTITRNIADANVALTVTQSNAGSTGNILNLANSSGTVAVVTQAGNVGIGTTTPAQLLHIDSNAVGLLPIIQLSGAGGTIAKIGRASNFISGGAGDLGIGVAVGQSIYIGTGGTAGIVIASTTNNVGIGTTSPSGRLHIVIPSSTGVAGDAQVYISDSVAVNPQELRMGVNTAGLYSYIQSAQRAIANDALVLNPNGGNVGIGTTSPAAKLDIYGTAGTGDIFAISSSSNTRLLTVKSTGNVGIGSSTPADTLTLVGTFSVNGSSRANNTILTGIQGNGSLGGGILFSNSDYVQASAGTSLKIAPGAISGTTYYQIVANSLGQNSTAALMLQGTNTASLVGIGTSTPNTKLEVYGASGADMFRLTNNAGGAYLYGFSTAGTSASIGAGGSLPLLLNQGGGNVGIGSTSPLSTLSVTGTGTTNPFTVASSSGNAMLTVLSNGNVGINTAAPNTTLEVGGTLRATRGPGSQAQYLEMSNSGSGIFLTASSTGNGKDLIINNQLDAGSGLGGAIRFQVGSVLSDRLTISSAGNVGIGTTTPAQLLTVYGASNPIIRVTGSGNSAAFIDITSDGTGAVQTRYITSNVARWAVGSDPAASNNFVFSTGASIASSQQAVITTAGNFGIGTTSPTSGLEVATSRGGGNTALFGAINQAGSLGFRRASDGNLAGFVGYLTNTESNNLTLQANGGSGLLSFYTGATEKMRIDQLGNVGIGTTSPQAIATNVTTLDIRGSVGGGFRFGTGTASSYLYDAGTLTLGTGDARALALQTSGQTRLTVDASGNVGIGTTTPAAALDVYSSTGTAYAASVNNPNTGAGAGGLLVNLGSGNGSSYAFRVITAVGGTNAFSVMGDGKVGVGTSSPRTTMEINGTLRITNTTNGAKFNDLATDANGYLSMNNVSLGGVFGSSSGNWNLFQSLGPLVATTSGYYFSNSSNATLGSQDTGLYRLRAGVVSVGNATAGDTSGTLVAANVGIGTSTPSAKFALHDLSGLAGTNVLFNIASSTASGTATTSLFTILGNGNVGLGTSSPLVKLSLQSAAPIISLTNTNSGGGAFQLRNGSFGNGVFDIFDVKNNRAMITINRDDSGSGQVMIGTSSNSAPGNNSRLFVYGGGNGANIDAMGDPSQGGGTGDTTSIEAEGSDWGINGNSNSIAMRYYGVGFPNGIVNYLGIRNHNIGILDFGTSDYAVLRTSTSTAIRFGVNNAEGMQLSVNNYLGIGTTSPVARLSVHDSSGLTGTNPVFVIASSTSTGTATTTLLTVLGNGRVGIGTTTPGSQLTTTGTVQFANYGSAGATVTTDANGNISVSSDERLKNINGSFSRGLAEIEKLSPILYHWNATSGLDQNGQYAGFSAQNVQSAIPEAVATDNRGYLTLADRPIIAASVNAIKELAGQTGALSTTTASLAGRLASVEAANAANAAATSGATLPHALTATEITAQSLTIASGVSAGTLTTHSVNADGTVSAARYIVPATAQVFTAASTTMSAVLPAEALTEDGVNVDLYKLASYAVASVQALATRTDLLATRIDEIDARLGALEAARTATSSVSQDAQGVLGLTATTIQNIFQSFGIFIRDGIAQFTTLVTHQLVFSSDTNGTSSASSVVIPAGQTEFKVVNTLILPTSKIFITFTSSVNGSWYISKKEKGSFTVTLASGQASEVTFDYFLVQTEGQIAAVAAPLTPAPTTPAPTDTTPPPAPVSQDGGPTVSLNGQAAVQIPQGAPWTDPGATALAADGTDLTSGIAVSGGVDTNTAGLYTVTYRATDAAGKYGEASRIVTVIGAPSSTPAPSTPAPTVTAGPAGTGAGTGSANTTAPADSSPAAAAPDPTPAS
ncbi:MAG: hypothetical protein JWN90_489 [Parcubacteria group bacterium]|nr:hypothetical protein [Parcubacteria group bacterium]